MFITAKSGREGDGGGIKREGCQVTAVPDCVFTFLGVKPLDILKETLGQVLDMFLVKKPGYLWQEVSTSQAVAVMTKPYVLV